VVKAEQYARRPPRRQVHPDLPQSVSQWPAQRHPGRPSPLRTQQVLPYGVPLGFRQSLQPLPHGLISRPQAVKNQRDFSRLQGFRHPAPYMVLLYLKMYNQKVILRQPGTFGRITCHPFNTLHFHSNANKKVIDKQCTSVLFSRVFANQNLRRSTLLARVAVRLLNFRHHTENPAIATPFVPAAYKRPLPQLLSLHILTNARGVWGCARSFVALCIKSVSQLFSNQAVPHSFSKMPGCHPTIPILELNLETLQPSNVQTCQHLNVQRFSGLASLTGCALLLRTP